MSKPNHVWVPLLLWFLLTFGSPHPTRAGTNSELTLKDVMSAWDSREQHVSSGKFIWTEERTVIKESLVSPLPKRVILQKSSPQPPKDIINRIASRLTFDGNRMRYHSSGPAWDGGRNEFLNREHTSLFDGQESKVFWTRPAINHPSGVVNTENFNVDIASYHLAPLLWACRPKLALRSIQLAIDPEGGLLNGRPCLVLTQEVGRTPIRGGLLSVWVDPEAAFSVLRFVIGREGKVFLQGDISYSHNSNPSCYVPTSWRITRFQGGKIQELNVSKVDEYELNCVFPVDEFHFDFPAGTDVIDKNTKTRYIARDNNNRRIVEPKEYKSTYEQLLASESGKGMARTSTAWRSPLSTAIYVALGLITFILIWRRKRGAATKQDSLPP